MNKWSVFLLCVCVCVCVCVRACVPAWASTRFDDYWT